MHAASRHGTLSLTSLPRDGEVSCEVIPPRSPIRSLTSLDRATRPLTPYKETLLMQNVISSLTAKSWDSSMNYISFSQCPQEESLDRDLPAQHVLNHLANIADHAMHLDELWEQREVKLKSHKRFSSQFLDFEKEIRKVSLPFLF